jgi:DNA-binding winged helix-turn-helix (wHTH) protein
MSTQLSAADLSLVTDPMLPPPWLQTRRLTDDVIVTGRLAVDVAALAVSVDDAVLHPSGTELRLLVVLALRLGRAVLYDELVRLLWWREYDSTDERMRAAYEHVLRVSISRLRQRLGPTAAGLLVTIPTIGLRLERVPPGGLPPAPARRPTLADRGRWARSHARCVACGTTARRHWAHGICEGCRPHDRPTRWELLRERRKDSAP